jgi:triosephosphate isomerase
MSMPQRRLVIGNWKMNGTSVDGPALAIGVAERMRQSPLTTTDVVLCPPATLLSRIVLSLSGSPIAVGGQDCHAKAGGAFTGDISAPMLVDAGCRYVIVGHSERRAYHRETDADVQAKVAAAEAAGLIAVVCVGETLGERDAGTALNVVERQLLSSLPDGPRPATSVVAYEPVWAIGTGRTPTPDDIGTVHAHIKSVLARRQGDGRVGRVLYGGSVKGDNAALLLSVTGVDGALVGGASLKLDEFWTICRACG